MGMLTVEAIRKRSPKRGSPVVIIEAGPPGPAGCKQDKRIMNPEAGRAFSILKPDLANELDCAYQNENLYYH